MLILETKLDENIVLRSGDTVITIRPLLRERNGNFALGFTAPRTVEITRVKIQGTDDYGKT